jgi:pimeloyl-ACP methyl ester carboxylesterase
MEINGVNISYTDTGQGTPIVFSHGLLMSGEMFRAQISRLKDRYRCISYDHRGQGGSEVTGDGYDMETLTSDAAALIEKLDAGPCHFVGLSMGGFVGMRLAARHPELIRSLVLLETSADPEPAENVTKYRRLNFIARWFGLGLVINQVMPIMFGTTFMNDPARAADRKEWSRRIVGNHRIGITRAVKGVIERKGVFDELGAITCPTLVAVGDEDVATVAEKSVRMVGAIKGAVLERIPNAGHSSTIEQPDFVSDLVERFLAPIDGKGKKRGGKSVASLG